MSVTISAALKAHLALHSQTTRTIVSFVRKDATAYYFTDHDRPITYSGHTYLPAYDRTNVVGSADLSVDNLQQLGAIDSTQITEEDLRIGNWDYARFVISQVNYADLTMGARIIREGWLGEVSLERLQYSADLNGLTKAYAVVLGKLTGATCRHDLFDAGCTIDPGGSSGSPPMAYTVTGTIDSVGDDGVTLYDSARTEPGPTGGVSITSITKANPGVVTLASTPSPALTNLSLGIISGATGMTAVNAQTQVHDPSGTTFWLSIDTSGFPTYTGGGTFTPLGALSGYFDFGLITFTSGLNSGFSMEIARYAPGVLVLALPMPYAVAASDAYTLTAGCDKFLPTCRDKFGGNVVNFDGEWYLTGNDKLLAIGKQG
jgi:hypothetical protein